MCMHVDFHIKVIIHTYCIVGGFFFFFHLETVTGIMLCQYKQILLPMAEKKTLSKSAWIKEKSYTFTTSVPLLRDNQFYFLFFESFSYTSVLWLMNLKISIDSPLLKLTKLKKKTLTKFNSLILPPPYNSSQSFLSFNFSSLNLL